MFLLMPVLMTLNGLLGVAYLVIVVTFFAFLSYRYFEVPVNRRIRGWFNLKPSVNA
jgi:peptidoglycan/LPS O-acetylase OafA/YrhL